MDKLKSRKLWFAVLSAVASVVLPAFGIPTEIVAKLGSIAMAYLGAQGAVDAVEAFKK